MEYNLNDPFNAWIFKNQYQIISFEYINDIDFFVNDDPSPNDDPIPIFGIFSTVSEITKKRAKIQNDDTFWCFDTNLDTEILIPLTQTFSFFHILYPTVLLEKEEAMELYIQVMDDDDDS